MTEATEELGLYPHQDEVSREEFAEWEAELEKLRLPFPADQIEKLPKPTYRNAWADQPKSHCDVCGGYHPRGNTIHLDYVGHANCTNRLLNADLTWNWEPLAYTEQGTPLFSDNGLWIKLTVCGVTRIGYGDGASVKEVIGDAIRNAAMRFGVALDLWAKINLHEERNPGDGPTQQRGGGQQRQSDTPGGQRGGGVREARQGVASDSPPAANQDALDSLGSVCDEHGYDRRTMRDQYAAWVGEQSIADTSVKVTDLLDAPSEYIIAFAAHLIAALDPPDGDDGGGDADAVAGEPETVAAQSGTGADRGDADAEVPDGDSGQPDGTAAGDGDAAEPAAGQEPVDADGEAGGDEAQSMF